MAFRRERVQDVPQSIDNLTIMPESERVTLELPYWRGVWKRPTALIVENGGDVKRIPVGDITRQGQLVLLGVAALVSFFGWLAASQLRRRQ